MPAGSGGKLGAPEEVWDAHGHVHGGMSPQAGHRPRIAACGWRDPHPLHNHTLISVVFEFGRANFSHVWKPSSGPVSCLDYLSDSAEVFAE